jgi:hypothetical protein
MMRMILATAALALASCTTTPVAGPPSSAPIAKAGSVILSGERGFAAAEIVYTAAANNVGRAVDAGMIHGATATKVRGWNAEARKAIVKGKATADLAEKARAAAALFGFADSLNALKGSN